MTSGLFLLDKRAGISSAKAIAEVDRRLGISKSNDKIGHAGTLDPFATGLLVVLIGKATRLATFALHGLKTYEGHFRLGLTTDSDDITGSVLTRSAKVPPTEAVLAAASKFMGLIQQTPPQISAISVKGERAYDIVRRGREVVLAARSVEVRAFTLEHIEPTLYRYHLHCSPGTYVRSVARDLGAVLGCGAVVESLRRVRSEPFAVQDAKVLEELTFEDLIGPRKLLAHLPEVQVSSQLFSDLQSGKVKALQEVSLAIRSAPELIPPGASPLGVMYASAESGVVGGVLALSAGELKFGVNL